MIHESRSIPVLAILALALAPAMGQQLCVTIWPNPAPAGSVVTVTAQAAAPNLATPFGCLLTSVRSGMPNGPTVNLFPCTFLPGVVPQCGSATFRQGVWTASMTPGQYWFEIALTAGQFGPALPTEWFCVTVDDPTTNPAPALSSVNVPTFGTTFLMSLVAPSHPLAGYGVALAATTNTGIPYAGGHAALDPDFLLSLSLTQDPAFFTNFSGSLDITGASPQIGLAIPPLAGIPCLPIHAQAVVFTAGGFVLSNALPITIH
jgi:hypothetical protein